MLRPHCFRCALLWLRAGSGNAVQMLLTMQKPKKSSMESFV
jgi:hypothetical protein